MENEIKDAVIQARLDKLVGGIKAHSTIQKYKELAERVANNQQLTELVEAIKDAQKDAVQYAHYGKPEAERAALAQADALTAEFEAHPLVLAYREQLKEANDLLQYITNRIQSEVNQGLEEEQADASKD